MRSSHIIQSIKKHKISFQNLIIFIFAVIIVLVNVLTITMYSVSYRKLAYNNILKTQETTIENLIDLVEAKLDSQSQITISISNNERIREIILNKPTNLLTQITNDEEVKNIFLDYSGSLKHIYSVNIFTRNFFEPLNNMMVGNYSEVAAPYAINDYSVFEKYVLNDYLYSYKNEVFLNVFKDKSVGLPMLMTLRWITNDDEQIGVLALLMPFDYAFSTVSDLGRNSESMFYIIDNEGRQIYDTVGPDREYLLEDSEFTDKILSYTSFGRVSTTEYKNYIVSYSKLENVDWTIIEVTPVSTIFTDYKKELTKVINLSGLATILIIIFIYFLNRFMLKGLRLLLKNIKAVKGGKLDIESNSSKLTEIDELNTNFVRMTNQIQALMTEIYEVNKKEKESELKALQAQINPHFLYNTLDALYWMSDDDNVSEIISSLGKFFRLSLSKGMDLVTIEDELMQVRSYINIQMRIYEGRFIVNEEIDPDVKQYYTIKLMIQPLVENSILHGFKEMDTGGVITIKVYKQENDIVVEVTDNGNGVDLDAINKILQGENTSSGYGIRNVNERIHLKFGEKYGLRYSNSQFGGTKVTVILPQINEG